VDACGASGSLTAVVPGLNNGLAVREGSSGPAKSRGSQAQWRLRRCDDYMGFQTGELR
jgi:hypothetical protein